MAALRSRSRQTRGSGPHPSPRGLGRVLVAVNFLPGAEAALARAFRLRLAPRGEICLLHVLPPKIPRTLRDLVWRGATQRMDRWVERSQQILQRRGRPDVRVQGAVTQGRTHEEIGQAAAAWNADLVVLGRTGGARRPWRPAPGTTACRVVRTSPVPVLVVVRRGRSPYRRPLVGVDLSPTCRRAVRTLLRLLDDHPPAQVTVLHADETPFEDALLLGGVTREELHHYRRTHAARTATAVSRFLREFHPASAGWRVIHQRGDPRPHLLAQARSPRHDLVVLGTHGRSGLGRTLLGSVAETLTRAAEVDVLVAPQRSG